METKNNSLAITNAATEKRSLESLKGLKGNEYRKAWNKLHPESCRQAKKAWRKRNPDKVGKVPREITLAYRANGGRKRHHEIYYSQWETATMRREPWGEVEDCIVMDRKAPDKELAAQLGRSVRAIQIRRCKLTKQNLEEVAESNPHGSPRNHSTP